MLGAVSKIRRREPLRQTTLGFAAQEVIGRRTRCDRVIRQPRFTKLQSQRTATRNLYRVFERLGQIGEQLSHLGGAAQVLLWRVAPFAGRIAELAAAMDADTYFVRLVVLGTKKAHLVGRDHWHRTARSKIHSRLIELRFTGTSQALHFQVIAVTEQIEPACQCTVGQFLAAVGQQPPHIALTRAGQCDQTAGGFRCEPGISDERVAALLTLKPRSRDQSGQIAIALGVLAQQTQSRRTLAIVRLAHPQIHADDRLHTGLERGAIELQHAEQVVQVGDRDRGAPLGLHGLDQLRNTHHAVAERIFRMHGEVDERLAHAVAAGSESLGSASSDFTGAKLRRWAKEGPRRRRASRCAAVP